MGADPVAIPMMLTSVLTESGELAQFLDGAARRFGDPAEAICQIFVPWNPDITRLRDIRPAYRHQDRALVLDINDGNQEPVFELPISDDLSPRIGMGGIEAFGLRKVCSGVWALAPSLNLPEIMHGFVVFHGVPDPAPWESRIILVST